MTAAFEPPVTCPSQGGSAAQVTLVPVRQQRPYHLSLNVMLPAWVSPLPFPPSLSCPQRDCTHADDIPVAPLLCLDSLCTAQASTSRLRRPAAPAIPATQDHFNQLECKVAVNAAFEHLEHGARLTVIRHALPQIILPRGSDESIPAFQHNELDGSESRRGSLTPGLLRCWDAASAVSRAASEGHEHHAQLRQRDEHRASPVDLHLILRVQVPRLARQCTSRSPPSLPRNHVPVGQQAEGITVRYGSGGDLRKLAAAKARQPRLCLPTHVNLRKVQHEVIETHPALATIFTLIMP